MHNQKVVLQEIIRQFNEQVTKLFGNHEPCLEYNPNIMFAPLGENEPHRIRRLIDDFMQA